MSDPIGDSINDPTTDPTHARVGKRLARKVWWRLRHELRTYPAPLMSIGAMGAALALIALVYLGYDLAKGKLSPCEAIFQETSLGLSTRISFLKTEGELQIGREQLTDLDERAQMAALNLKTCCTVLDAGRLDPEQFLQCKGSARAYEARLHDIADLVRKAVKEGMTTSSIAANASPPPRPAADQGEDRQRGRGGARRSRATSTARSSRCARRRRSSPCRRRRRSNVTIAGAGARAQRRRAQHQRDRARRVDHRLRSARPRTPTTSPSRRLRRTATGSASSCRTAPPRWSRGSSCSITRRPASARCTRRRKAPTSPTRSSPTPATPYVVRVSNYYGESVGVYLLRIVATKAYDAHEPNDDILTPRRSRFAEPVAAGIMDKDDVDYFAVTSGAKDGVLRALVQNRSTTSAARGRRLRRDQGADRQPTTTPRPAETRASASRSSRSTTYYVRVRDYYSSAAGDYTLTVVEAAAGRRLGSSRASCQSRARHQRANN